LTIHRSPGSLAVVLLVLAQNAHASDYRLPPADVDIVGRIGVVEAKYEDTLAELARTHDLGHEEMVLANPGVDRWLPGAGTRLVLPTRYILPTAPREGIVVNLPEMRLYYYPKPSKDQGPRVITHPVSVGRMDWASPLGRTRVTVKVKDPAWYPPESIRKEHAERGDELPKRVPPGPDNPLGTRALRLGIPGYLIHGTNRPYGVGMRVTHGCVRMYPEDIEALYYDVPTNTPVHFVDQPFKAAMLAGTLFIEAHPPLDEHEMSEDQALRLALDAVLTVTGGIDPGVDMARLRALVRSPSGVPEPIPLSGNSGI